MGYTAVIDYDCGNMFSISRALERFDAKFEITRDPEAILNASKVILPGVGSYGEGIKKLKERNLVDPLHDFFKSGKLMMGICLGMQLLVDSSDEFGFHEGLGFIAGRTEILKPLKKEKVPHIGWNSVLKPKGSKEDIWTETILEGIEEGRDFYFMHSHMVVTKDPDNCLAETEYGGIRFASIIKKNNLIGCQFHPEKSGKLGLSLVRKFIKQN